MKNATLKDAIRLYLEAQENYRLAVDVYQTLTAGLFNNYTLKEIQILFAKNPKFKEEVRKAMPGRFYSVFYLDDEADLPAQ